MRTAALAGLVALCVAGGAGYALAARDEPTLERQDRIDRSTPPEPVPQPHPSALPRSAPAGDLRGNAAVTAGALLLALVAMPIRRWRDRRDRGRRAWGRRPVTTGRRRHGR
jgi:hypothetical protein